MPALMIQGTGSDVGKSLLVAALCRAYVRRGLRVLPFKPQNMSNNAGVTADGGEIGRAQILQARACGVAPTVHMNPVLLKPQSETGAQVVLRGQVVAAAEAAAYQRSKGTLLPAVLESFHHLAARADLVLVEGAGSPAEVNLRAGDIANMGFARAAGVPVVLAGDIERGGVIAALVGTHTVLEAADRALVGGFLVNKFRGDVRLFDEGRRIIAARTGWRDFGVLPHMPEAAILPAEDAMDLRRHLSGEKEAALADLGGLTPAGAGRRGSAVAPHGVVPQVRVVVPLCPRIANFDDLDPLRLDPRVALTLVPAGQALPGDADVVILPGSKATLADLAFLRRQGWDIDLLAHVRRGGRVLGLCGGYQMLGRRVADPHGIEGPPGEAPGLGLLDVDTVLAGAKTLGAVTGVDLAHGAPFHGYEMHMGVTDGGDRARPLLRLADGRREGATSADGRVAGTYVHGLFADDRQRAAWLDTQLDTGSSTGGGGMPAPAGPGYETRVEGALDALAGAVERHLDLDGLLALARGGRDGQCSDCDKGFTFVGPLH